MLTCPMTALSQYMNTLLTKETGLLLDSLLALLQGPNDST